MSDIQYPNLFGFNYTLIYHENESMSEFRKLTNSDDYHKIKGLDKDLTKGLDKDQTKDLKDDQIELLKFTDAEDVKTLFILNYAYIDKKNRNTDWIDKEVYIDTDDELVLKNNQEVRGEEVLKYKGSPEEHNKAN